MMNSVEVDDFASTFKKLLNKSNCMQHKLSEN